MNNYITHIEIEGLFGEKDIRFSPDPKVNVLAGINGSGKSTVLKIINNTISIKSFENGNTKILQSETKKSSKGKQNLFQGSVIQFSNNNEVTPLLIDTFDIRIKNKSYLKKDETLLDYELRHLINGNLRENTFTKFALKKYKDAYLNKEDDVGQIQQFIDLVNGQFFIKTCKELIVDDKENMFIKKQSKEFELSSLSSGEKQLLILLLNVLLSDKENSILLLDEPEITLHIEWQQNLIDAIFKINPNIQLFIATHASSIFFNGYQDKLIFMEDISFPTNAKEYVG